MIICFDMDGTIADLYGVENWLEMITVEDPTPYLEAEPMCNMITLAEVLRKLQEQKVEIRIITWLSKESSEEYKNEVRRAKKEWLNKYNFPYDNFHGVQYGATKADSVRKYAKEEEAILIDDNAEVRKGWHLGRTIDPTSCDLIEILTSFLD